MIKASLAAIAALSLAAPAQAFISIEVCPDGGGICVRPPTPVAPPRYPDYYPTPAPGPDARAGFRERVAQVVLKECERRTSRTWADLWAAVDTQLQYGNPSHYRLWEKLPYSEQLSMIKELGGVLCS